MAMSLITILAAGSLAITLWFEVSTTDSMQQKEKDVFILTALLETLLFLVSVIGFSGVVVRKQLFVMIYAYALYVHLVINTIVGIYLLWMISHTQNVDVVHACKQAVQDTQATSQCTGVLNIVGGIFYGITAFVLFIEFYGAAVVTRYMRQLRGEKKFGRESRIRDRESRIAASQHTRYSTLQNQEAAQAEPAHGEFNPYEVYEPTFGGLPQEEGYGGGKWSLHDIARDEKQKGNVEEDVVEDSPPNYPTSSHGHTPPEKASPEHGSPLL